MNRRYLEVTSAYRDRNKFPNPADFEVLFGDGSARNAFESVDPVVDGYPYYSFTGNSAAAGAAAFAGGNFVNPILNPTASTVDNFYNGYRITDTTLAVSRIILGYVGSSQTVTLDHPFPNTWAALDNYTLSDPSTNTVVQFQPAASQVDNFYINSILYDNTLNEYRLITSYIGNTRTATLASAFGGGWALTDSYSVRDAPPLEVAAFQAGSTTRTAVLAVTSSIEDNFYAGKYIYVTSGPAIGNVRLITTYDEATLTISVTPAFTAAPLVGNTYEILNWTRDNFVPLNYTGSTVSQENEVCYEIELKNLSVPNKLLAVGFGSTIAFYPYLYVSLGSVTTGLNRGIIYSNDPHATTALFTVPIPDVNLPDTTQFIKLDSDGAVQTVKFKPNDSLKFRLFLSNGETFTLAQSDQFSPLPPNGQLQISALFSIKRT